MATTAVGLNVLVNGVLPDRMHIPASLAAAAAISGFAGRAGAGLQDQGLAPVDVPRGALVGLASATPIGVALAAGIVFSTSRQFYSEQRITNSSLRQAAYETCVRIPIGTALPEEIIFRGAMLGLLSRHHPPLIATAISSLLFGLWHVAPTIDRLSTNAAVSKRPLAHQAAWVATTVAATSASGFLLAWLRYRSRSIVAPWLAHGTANAVGFAVGWTVARLARNQPPGQPLNATTPD